ncbi:hypothetical protein GJ496_005808 [Pomphorhynchus laevis]|nr:hypothetical protein GJ496_005808 [Pomphorhynchus laevis]
MVENTDLTWFNNQLLLMCKTVRRAKLFVIRKQINAIKRLKFKREKVENAGLKDKLTRKITNKLTVLQAVRQVNPKETSIVAFLESDQSILSEVDKHTINLSRHKLVQADMHLCKSQSDNVSELASKYWIRHLNKLNWQKQKVNMTSNDIDTTNENQDYISKSEGDNYVTNLTESKDEIKIRKTDLQKKSAKSISANCNQSTEHLAAHLRSASGEKIVQSEQYYEDTELIENQKPRKKMRIASSKQSKHKKVKKKVDKLHLNKLSDSTRHVNEKLNNGLEDDLITEHQNDDLIISSQPKCEISKRNKPKVSKAVKSKQKRRKVISLVIPDKSSSILGSALQDLVSSLQSNESDNQIQAVNNQQFKSKPSSKVKSKKNLTVCDKPVSENSSNISQCIHDKDCGKKKSKKYPLLFPKDKRLASDSNFKDTAKSGSVDLRSKSDQKRCSRKYNSLKSRSGVLCKIETNGIHPSWEASQQRNNQCNIRIVKSEATRKTFDLDSE